jgi:hypothetical protein
MSEILEPSVQPFLETGVLDPKLGLLGFHMLGPPICPYVPDKEAWRRQRKEVYYMAWDLLWEEAEKHSAHLQPSSGYRHEL